ncbi:MAG: hypothetical protein H0X04_05935 [Chthoniobacterales bacterium]|nr:hypothetical protein [Chthoniobacterales bacterium]
MSTAELIEQIKALPAAELEVVRDFILSGEVKPQVPRYATDEEFDGAVTSVFEKHHELLRRLAQ